MWEGINLATYIDVGGLVEMIEYTHNRKWGFFLIAREGKYFPQIHVEWVHRVGTQNDRYTTKNEDFFHKKKSNRFDLILN